MGRKGDDEPSDKTELRLRILRIAAEHFVRFGYRRTNIGDVARDVGIGKGSIYLHFASKKALLIACFAYEKLDSMPALAAIEELEPEARLARYLDVALGFPLRSPLTAAYLRGDREISAVLSDYHAKHEPDQAKSMAYLEALVDPAGRLSASRRRALTNMVVVVSRLAAHLPEHAEVAGTSAEAIVAELAGVLARGIDAERAR